MNDTLIRCIESLAVVVNTDNSGTIGTLLPTKKLGSM